MKAFVVSLTRAARDLQGIFQLHQNVLDRAAEINHLLHSLISDFTLYCHKKFHQETQEVTSPSGL